MKIFCWCKIVEIFNKDCNRSWEIFYGKYVNECGYFMVILLIIVKYDVENVFFGFIFDFLEVRNCLILVSDSKDINLVGEKLFLCIVLSFEEKIRIDSLGGEGEKSYILF